jgi:signal transduction histidine kinase
MDHFKRLQQQIRLHLFLMILATNLLIIAAGALLYQANVSHVIAAAAFVAIVLMFTLLLTFIATRHSLEPIRFIWQAIMHIAPEHSSPAPDMSKIKTGRELITTLVMQVYQFASQQDGKDLAEHRKNLSQAANVVDHLPLPLFVFNKQQFVTNASASALDYCQIASADLFGKPLFDSLNLEFPSERTLEQWITECQKSKATDTATWERVRVVLKDQKTVKQCDIAAYYNRDNPSGTEFIVTLFDRTGQYDQDDANLSFVALAVHELRTPLTMLRGYIEVFEDELGPKLDSEMQDFMRKMSLSSQQLTVFINNILNIARIENNQLTLHLREDKWDTLLRQACQDVELRAQVHGKTIEYNIAPNLPSVAVDPVSITEVVINLVDNAIKYGGESKKIIVAAQVDKDGMVETTVQDFGVGIPTSVLPNLFERFYRNHRTRAQIGGSGLGLYLCKALITAHGGQIWASSKDGEGSTFGFTVQPYAQLADGLKTGNNEIVRGAHGWIKNHSLYRR